MPFHIPFFFSFAVAIDVLEGHLYAGFYEIRERKEFVHGNGALHGLTVWMRAVPRCVPRSSPQLDRRHQHKPCTE